MTSSIEKAEHTPTKGKTKPVLSQQYGGVHSGSWVDRLPASWIPYIQLARLSPPGSHNPDLLPPPLRHPPRRHPPQLPPPTDVLKASFSLLLWIVFFSNAAHAWDDLIDSPIDLLISRTKNRPIPRGAISPTNALLFALSQFICALLALVFTTPNPETIASVAPHYVLATIYYPFAKRHTHFVQVILGLTLGWCVIIGSASMGLNPIVTSINGVPCSTPTFPAGIDIDTTTIEHKITISPSTIYSISITVATFTVLLFVASATWTIIYDTIYAHQDLADDIKNNVKSLAVLFRETTPDLLWILLTFMTSALILCGLKGGFTAWFAVLAAGGSALALGGMILGVDLEDSGSCWWWFKYGCLLTGGSITAGLVGEYIFVRTGMLL